MKNKRKENIVETYLKRVVSKDKSGMYRYQMNGVFGAENGVKVATDGRSLIAGKLEHSEFYKEGKITEPKTGDTIEGSFVDWKQVIPSVYDSSIFIQKNFLSVKGFSKIEGFGVRITDEIIISPKYIDLLEEREWVLMINGKNSPIVAIDPTSPSFFLVIMPMRFDTMEKTSIDLRNLTDWGSLTEEEIEKRNNLLIDTVNELTGRPKREVKTELEPVDEVEIPTWAICYIANGDDSGLSDEDIEEINDFLGQYKSPTFEYGEEEYFSNDPAFGLPTNVVETKVYEPSA